jgi:single-strand DNA-binding protein
MNTFVGIGNIVRTPEARTTTTGKSVVSASIAINEKFKDAAGEKKVKTLFLDLVVWGKQGEVFSRYLDKGDKVAVRGRLEEQTWEKQDGSKAKKILLVVEEFTMLGKRAAE